MNTKKRIAGCLALFVLAGNAARLPQQVQADVIRQISSDHDNAAKSETGGLSAAAVRTDFYRADELKSSAGVSLSQAKVKSADTSYSLLDSEWADSGSDYYFSLLNTAEKKLYLEFKKQADSYLTGTDSFQTTQIMRDGENVKVYILPLVSYDGLETAQMKKVFQCFLFENPQYYFMRNSVIYSENTKMAAVGLYELFADGNTRAQYTARLVQKLDDWAQQIEEAETASEKVRRIHQIVCSQVSYNEDMAVDDPDDREMSQSCISAVLFRQSTVCAGYAQMFSLLCNRAGIPCVTVTSAGHAWNKLRTGGIWYNADCTWDDARGDEKFLYVTDEQLQAEDTQLKEHTMSKEWEGTAPSCTVSFDRAQADAADTGANVLAPDGMSEVSAQSREKGRISVTFAPVEGCDGYVVQYAAGAAMNPANKKAVEKTSCAVSGLKSGRTYYVRVRAYTLGSKGEKLYGPYSQKVKVSVR